MYVYNTVCRIQIQKNDQIWSRLVTLENVHLHLYAVEKGDSGV